MYVKTGKLVYMKLNYYFSPKIQMLITKQTTGLDEGWCEYVLNPSEPHRFLYCECQMEQCN